MSWLSKAAKTVERAVNTTVHQPGHVIKKIAEVNAAGAIGAASGFVTGGVKGAIVGGITAGGNAAIALSKQHDVDTTRLIKESVGFGAASGFATGLVTQYAPAAQVKIAEGAKQGGGIAKFFSNGVKSLKAAGIVGLGAQLLSGVKAPQNAPEALEDKINPYPEIVPDAPDNAINISLPDGEGGGGAGSDFPLSGPYSEAGLSSSPLIPILIALGLGLVIFSSKRRAA